MRYVVIIATDPTTWADATEEVRQEYFDAHHAFERFVDENGRRINSAALGDADTATTIRNGTDGPIITDGPFAEVTEQVNGYYDVDLPNLDTAIAAAQLLPKAYTLEIRPVVGVEGYESV